ncbi:MAG: hypothetical protein ACODAQ_08585 [Phycisphaeraceae bacterium]
MTDTPFNLWAFSCAHVGTDLGREGRESLAEAIRQSESDAGFDWHIALNLGDHSGNQGEPADDEGEEVVRQYGALQQHRREQVYDIAGNHDRSDVGHPEGWWTRKWIDPAGENTSHSGVDPAKRPYPIEGDWERYSFRVGNVLFLMMSDRNEPSAHLPREEGGGNPSGVVTAETFAWWKQQVEANPDAIIVTCHHYMLKDTTVASGEFEGCWKDADGTVHAPYHGYKPRGTPRGASYLYWVGGTPNAQAFEQYLAEHPGAIDLWMGGHTHTHPDDTAGDKSHIETKWKAHFANICALTRHHGGQLLKQTLGIPGCPMSRVLTFTPGSDELRIRCYLHTSDYAPQGWYDKAERTLKLRRPFTW